MNKKSMFRHKIYPSNYMALPIHQKLELAKSKHAPIVLLVNKKITRTGIRPFAAANLRLLEIDFSILHAKTTDLAETLYEETLRRFSVCEGTVAHESKNKMILHVEVLKTVSYQEALNKIPAPKSKSKNKRRGS